MTLTWIVIIAGAVLFVLIQIGRRTPEAQMRQPIIDTSTVPGWVKDFAFIAVVCAAIIYFVG